LERSREPIPLASTTSRVGCLAERTGTSCPSPPLAQRGEEVATAVRDREWLARANADG
jgi:hypothetical protein